MGGLFILIFDFSSEEDMNKYDIILIHDVYRTYR